MRQFPLFVCVFLAVVERIRAMRVFPPEGVGGVPVEEDAGVTGEPGISCVLPPLTRAFSAVRIQYSRNSAAVASRLPRTPSASPSSSDDEEDEEDEE